ncbi:zona pellucida sperm-binding protein 3-like [Tiliqua scincoides]|uniref:zona pellucida sperm-binding protein 3-like n=1 Tax=Tiliqua scincoides TaxID=71010 RepID=UPI003462A43B
MVVMVHRDLFGTGHLVQVAELSLGPKACSYTSLSISGKVIIFEVGLHECGIKLQMTPDSLNYHTSLHYNPRLASNPIIVRNSPAEIPIVCRFPRKDNVSSHAIEPTWMPFSLTMSAEGKLQFSLRLMTDDWSAERTSRGYQLGDELHVQADIYSDNHIPLRLYVDSCMATQTPDSDSTPRYTILDYHGCLVDGREHDVASAFRIPRPRPETLQFSVDAFRFTGDSSLIYIVCSLKVAGVDKEPDRLSKACSYSTPRNSWIPVEGSKDICNCCEARNCGSTRGWTRMLDSRNPHSQWHKKQMPSGSAIIDISNGETEADLVVGPLLILDAWDHQKDQVGTAEGGPPVIEAEAESAIGLQFILQADKELRWLLDSEENVTSSGGLLRTASENVIFAAAAKLSSDTDERSSSMPLPMEVAKVSLQEKEEGLRYGEDSRARSLESVGGAKAGTLLDKGVELACCFRHGELLNLPTG